MHFVQLLLSSLTFQFQSKVHSFITMFHNSLFTFSWQHSPSDITEKMYIFALPECYSALTGS